ncbi:hypothetical protein L484_007029 [Morus notabilis]|uniref:Uncharacterized protein n=1 Tax=Morus notabilis TaxID=981085 RepID=W9SCG0_9ROSA|nr:hypothetical protein L484_007029 [Morus notabilis]
MEETVWVEALLMDKGKAKEPDLLSDMGSTAEKGGKPILAPLPGSATPFMEVEGTEGGSSGGREGS